MRQFDGIKTSVSPGKLRDWLYVHDAPMPSDEVMREHVHQTEQGLNLSFPVCKNCGQPLTPIQRRKPGAVEACPHDTGPTHHHDHATATPGRNAPCPCGSGKKFKKCCGQ